MAPDSVVLTLNKFTSPRLCSWDHLGPHEHHSFWPISLPSTRSYQVPDPPGLFDGHVWPMYLKYKQEMEANGVEVGKALRMRPSPGETLSPAPPHGDHLGNLEVPPQVSRPIPSALDPGGYSSPAAWVQVSFPPAQSARLPVRWPPPPGSSPGGPAVSALTMAFLISVYLDGTKSREELFHQVLEEIQNSLLNHS